MTSNHNSLLRLNDAQQAAVTTTEGPLLVLAGPGSGKTAVITHRIAHLIRQGVPSHEIVALTFTNKAADEMKTRVEKLVNRHSVWIGTFHKFCARLLRTYGTSVGIRENFTIYDVSDARAALKEAFDIAEISSKHFSIDQIGGEIARAKHYAVDCESFTPRPGNALEAIVAKVYRAYAQVLRMANAVDFDDLLLQAFVLLRDNPELRQTLDERWRYILVDEYQDTNAAQFAIVRALSVLHPNLCATGDPDQSIYGWRGANLDNVLKFEQNFPAAQVIRLEQNYRSTKAILRVADQLIRNNVHRLPKSLVTHNAEGEAVRLVAYPNPQHEATDIVECIATAIHQGKRQPRDFAILYRANWLSRSFEHELRLRRIPYLIVHGHEFYERREIKDIFAYLHLLNNPADQIALQRIINVPPRKIGPATVSKLKTDALANRIPLLEAARRSGLNPDLSKQAAVKVAGFVALMDRLGEVRTESSVQKIVETVVEVTGFRKHLLEDGSEDGHERAANVDELIAAAAEFDQMHPDDGGLEAFLEMSALVQDADEWESDGNAVSLMTLHAAKGLEFPVVFVVGLEDGLLPHERNLHSDLELEEERRLLFVGTTRAKEELQLSRTLSRFRRGQNWTTIASRFLMELPRAEMEVAGPTSYEFFGPDRDDDGDDSFDPASFDDEVFVEPKPSPPVRSTPSNLKLVTAASMLEEATSKPAFPRTPIESFQTGMLVEHPEYGSGIIKALTGKANKRVATVCFGDQERSFRLAHSPLRVVK